MSPQRERESPKFSRCSIMARRSSRSLFQICAYLALLAVTAAAGQGESQNDTENTFLARESAVSRSLIAFFFHHEIKNF